MSKGTKAATDLDRRIGQRIRARRLQLGITQEALADALGLTFQQIQKYEKGTNRIATSRLASVATILKAPIARFLDPETGDPAAPDPAAAFLASRDGLRLANAVMSLPRDLTALFILLAESAAAHSRPSR